jgi:thioredoxin-like negative regulator of GroEL
MAIRSEKLLEEPEFLRQAVARAPDDATLLIQYGQCLFRLGRRQDALAIAWRADAAELTSPALHDALGTLLTHLEEATLALPHFQRAVEGAPTNVDFIYNLAMAQRMTGDFEAAEANLDRVIAVRPDDGEAYHARSDLRTQTPERNHVNQLERALRQSSGRRASLPIAFALAKELEDLGEYSRSFGHLYEACRSYRASLRYQVADDVAVLDKLRLTQSAATIANLGTDFDSQECIFIVGLPRSGTTLVERILAAHGEVYPAGELDAFPRVVVAAVAQQANAPVRKLDFVEHALKLDFRQLGPQYLAATRPRTGHTAKFTDKLPLNYLYAGLIHAALPRARFVALHRHPMDSCFAMYKTLFAAAYPFTYDLDDLCRYYVAWERLMRHWEAVIGEAWLPVSYEELVSDQERVSRRIVSHCGLSWQDRCLEFHRGPVAVTTASAVQVRRPVHAASVGKWRHYASYLEPLALYFEANGISVR